MKKKTIYGLILLVIGLAVMFWAYGHSPYAGIAEKLANELSGSYTLTELQFAGSMIVGAVLAVWGIYSLFRK